MITQKYIYAGNPDKNMSWIFIPDTAEAKAQAIIEGYTAFSTMSFDYEPVQGKPEPTRHGSLWLDIDSKGSPEKAVIAARSLLMHCHYRYGINLYSLRYYLSGGKGVHIEIPSMLFGGTDGHVFLPKIHKEMLRLLLRLPFSEMDRSMLDTSLYCMGKGKLLRAPNIQRPDGNYKVQLSFEEFMHGKIVDILPLVKTPREAIKIDTTEAQASNMTVLYDAAKYLVTLLTNKKQGKKGVDSLWNCEFLQHCYQNQATLTEPEWFRMVGILMSFGDAALPLVHEFSMGYPDYSFEETERKILLAQNKASRITCDYVREVYACTKQDCQVRAPTDLFFKQKSRQMVANQAFSLKADGVYYFSSNESEDAGLRICSPMKVLGKMRNPDGLGWARLVEFTAPDGQSKTLGIPMRDCTGRGDAVRSLLSDHGLEINMSSKVNSLLLEYIQHGGSEDAILLHLEKVGWHAATYILPDVQFGETMSEKIYFTQKNSLHSTSGNLEDWQQNIGALCQGNSLLVLLVSYALTGPLLRLCDIEGGGLHVYGASSTGKTTAALVTGSVCGGGGNRGYLHQWRSTHNALENTAVMHNDNLLVLDEVGQATAEVVSQVAYMLPNGQGRERMRNDASRRQALTWRLNFLSTGELTINDKIEETGKIRSMAGQVVRIIDLPIDSNQAQNLFTNLHGQPDAATISHILASASLNNYGTPLRAFMEQFCQNMQTNTQKLIQGIDIFMRSHVPSNASGQVQRVARKFGLMAAAGALATEWSILPFKQGEALAAAKTWFEIWLKERGGHGDLELNKALKRIEDHFTMDKCKYFTPIHASSALPYNCVGYELVKKGITQYLLLAPKFEDLIKGVNRKILLEELRKRSWVVLDDKGKVRETHSIFGENKRGIAFIPSVWQRGIRPIAREDVTFED